MAARKISSIDEAAGALAKVGAADAKLARIQAKLNDAIAAAKEKAEKAAGPVTAERETLVADIRTFCDKKRDELLGDGKGKSIEFATGKVGWRMGRAQLDVDAKRKDAIITAFLAKKATKDLVRITKSLDAQAILKAPDKIKGVRGLKILPAQEGFWVEPVAIALADGPAARAAE